MASTKTRAGNLPQMDAFCVNCNEPIEAYDEGDVIWYSCDCDAGYIGRNEVVNVGVYSEED